MQAINGFMASSLDYLLITLARKGVICKRFTFFDHYPLAFWGQCVNEFQSLFPND
jgi:hypothetical protein